MASIFERLKNRDLDYSPIDYMEELFRLNDTHHFFKVDLDNLKKFLSILTWEQKKDIVLRDINETSDGSEDYDKFLANFIRKPEDFKDVEEFPLTIDDIFSTIFEYLKYTDFSYDQTQDAFDKLCGHNEMPEGQLKSLEKPIKSLILPDLSKNDMINMLK